MGKKKNPKESHAPAAPAKDPRGETPANVSRALEIAEQGKRLAGQIAAAIAREEKFSKKAKEARDRRKELTLELIGLWGDERTGQSRLDFEGDDEDDDAPAPGTVLKGGKSEGKAAATKWVTLYGEHRLEVEMVAPGDWRARVDGKDLAYHHRTAQEAMDYVLCDEMKVPEAKARTHVWQTEAPSLLDTSGPFGTPGATEAHVATHKGKRLRVERRADGRWIPSVETGKDVRHEGEPVEGEAEAKARALQLAGYVETERRPVWTPAPAGVSQTKRSTSACDGKLLEVAARGTEIRAYVDGNYGGEHASVSAAKAWAEVTARGRKRAKGDDKLEWLEETVEDLEPPTTEYLATAIGPSGPIESPEGTLAQNAPGLWTGRVDGKPVAIALPRADAERITTKALADALKIPLTHVAWERLGTAGPKASAAE